MANYVEFELHVRGNRNACMKLYDSIIGANDKPWIVLDKAGYTDESHVLHIEGEVKGAIDAYSGRNDTLQKRSEYLHVEIQAHTWDENFDEFEHYKFGEVLRKEYVEPMEYLEWDTNEYPEFEEFCESEGIDPEGWDESMITDEYDGVVFFSRDSGEGIDFEFDF